MPKFKRGDTVWAVCSPLDTAFEDLVTTPVWDYPELYEDITKVLVLRSSTSYYHVDSPEDGSYDVPANQVFKTATEAAQSIRKDLDAVITRLLKAQQVCDRLIQRGTEDE